MKKLEPEKKVQFANINCRAATKALFRCYRRPGETDDLCLLRIIKTSECRKEVHSILPSKYIGFFRRVPTEEGFVDAYSVL